MTKRNFNKKKDTGVSDNNKGSTKDKDEMIFRIGTSKGDYNYHDVSLFSLMRYVKILTMEMI